MRNHITNQIKILGVLTFSALITMIFSHIFFPDNTPKINFQYLVKLFPKKIDSQKKLDTFSQLPISNMTQISRGVYAKEDKESNTIYIRVTKEARWQEKIIESDGKKIIILYPKKD